MNNDALNPDSTPDGLYQTPRVKKMTNMPIYIIAVLSASFCLILIYVINKKSVTQYPQAADSPGAAPVETVGRIQTAEGIADEMNALFPDEKNAGVESADTARPTGQERDELTDSDSGSDQGADEHSNSPITSDTERLKSEIVSLRNELNRLKQQQLTDRVDGQRLGRLSQETLEEQRQRRQLLNDIQREKFSLFKQSVAAATAVTVDAPMDGRTLSSIGNDAGAIRRAGAEKIDRQLAQISAPGRELGGANRAGLPDATRVAGGHFTPTTHYDLGNVREAGRKYQLRTGTIIPATLITGVKSDVAGAVMARVSQSVYDTATGSYLLIPQGTGLYGTYNTAVSVGQTRALVRWDRLIFPDGSTLDLLGMPGSDREGYTGFSDKVNNHYFKIFGSAFLLSLFSTTVTVALPEDGRGDDDDRSASEELSLAIAQQFNETASQVIRRNLDVAPTITIRSGYKFTILVNKDIHFAGRYRPLPSQ